MRPSEAGAIADILRNRFASEPDRSCLVQDGRSCTWRTLHERAGRVAQGLLGAGVLPGDSVVYLGRNSIEYVETLFGVSMAGAVLAAVNWRLSQREVVAVVADTAAPVVVVEREFLADLGGLRTALPTVRMVVVVGHRTTAELASVGGRNYETWLGEQLALDPRVFRSAADPGFEIYTSGTTGQPLCALFTAAAVIESARVLGDLLALSDRATVLVPMPIFHSVGAYLLLATMSAGARCVLTTRSDPDTLLDAIEREHITTTLVVPVVIGSLVSSQRAAPRDLSSLRTLGYGASPVTSELLRAAVDTLGCQLMQFYGMTETTCVAVLDPADHLDVLHPERLESCGRPVPGVQIVIVDPRTGTRCAEGVPGEVLIRARTNMIRYSGPAEATSAVMTADGYLRSGDSGYLSDGYLYLQDRLKDVIITGGENVRPAEVEAVLMTHPDVEQVAVIGIPSPRWGETVCAVVVQRDARDPATAAELIEFARGRLARFKCPSVIEFVTDLPRNAAGKVLRRTLREPWWAGHGRPPASPGSQVTVARSRAGANSVPN